MALAALNTFSDRSHAAVQAEMGAQKERIAELTEVQFKVKEMTEKVAAEFPLTAKLLDQTIRDCALLTAATLQAEGAQREMQGASAVAAGQVEQLRTLLQNADPIDLLEAVSGDLRAALQEQKRCLEKLQAKVAALKQKLAETRENRIALAQEIAALKNEL